MNEGRQGASKGRTRSNAVNVEAYGNLRDLVDKNSELRICRLGGRMIIAWKYMNKGK